MNTIETISTLESLKESLETNLEVTSYKDTRDLKNLSKETKEVTTENSRVLKPLSDCKSRVAKPLMSTLTENLSNPYRNRTNGLLLSSLFIENYKPTDTDTALYTLKDRDHTKDGRKYPSLYKLYLACEDLTEYSFAEKYLDGWDHWCKLCAAEWFKPYVQRWRTELELKIKSRALKNIQAEAAGQTKSSFNANKWLAEKGWMDKTTEPSRRGRPSKDEINRLAQEELQNNKDVQNDLKRLGLN